jgi:kinesin family member 11
MQGDIIPAPSGNPSFHAGMIPRVLFNLFYNLDSAGADYSVKISYLELYNEELRDLLSRNLTAPASSTQPMAQGNKSAAADPDGLKIFDDGGKRGIFVQGLEEVLVKSSEHALALLTKGSERRQVASTRSNDRSSRSHTVFTVTVHVKEPGVAGEDMLKTGKFNLVDLAGSEDIGKSGAEDQRAKEAGSINQSLLVLGRVMRDLVAKESYIPYRDSKLTRLLQDSLGGRTKTCIIATISPARSNIEETSNTLRYAYTAKHISNKPQVNARMTRNALLKEYVAEIERLKADVLAAREKNGIFFSEETWKEMTTQQELKQTEFEEAQKQVGIVEAQLRDVREEFEQNIGLLMRRDAELKVTKEKLAETEGTLERTEGELGITKVALEEEVVVRKAHQSSEVALDKAAQSLRSTAQTSLADLNGLFDKLGEFHCTSGVPALKETMIFRPQILCFRRQHQCRRHSG